MRPAKHILSAILIAALLSSGLPLHGPEDANRDSLTNLEDAILNVRDFTQTAHKPAVFTSKVKKVLSTLHVVAGLKTYIQPVKEKNSPNAFPAFDLPYLISSTNPSVLLNNCSMICEHAFQFESIFLTHPSPPPRQRLFC